MAVKKINPQTGQTYRVQPTTGGVFHVYPDGRKVFVKAGPAEPYVGWGWNLPQNRPKTSAPAAAPAAPPPPAQLAPDSQYFGENAQRTAALGSQLTANDQQGVSNKAARDEALRRLTADQPQDYAGAKVSANKQGLFYSSTLGNQLSDIAKEYTRRRSDVESSFTTSEDARLAARSAIQAGYTVDDAAGIAASADRQIGSDEDAATAGTLAPNAPAPKVKATKPKAFKTVVAHGTVYHVHPDGRRVPIRKATRP